MPKRLSSMPTQFALLGAMWLPSCVVGTDRPPTRAELASAPAEPVSTPGAASGNRVGCTEGNDDPTPRPRPDALWIDGYCHYDGIRYRWEPGHWETPPSMGTR
jgi:hypothetical protein